MWTLLRLNGKVVTSFWMHQVKVGSGLLWEVCQDDREAPLALREGVRRSQKHMQLKLSVETLFLYLSIWIESIVRIEFSPLV